MIKNDFVALELWNFFPKKLWGVSFSFETIALTYMNNKKLKKLLDWDSLEIWIMIGNEDISQESDIMLPRLKKKTNDFPYIKMVLITNFAINRAGKLCQCMWNLAIVALFKFLFIEGTCISNCTNALTENHVSMLEMLILLYVEDTVYSFIIGIGKWFTTCLITVMYGNYTKTTCD